MSLQLESDGRRTWAAGQGHRRHLHRADHRPDAGRRWRSRVLRGAPRRRHPCRLHLRHPARRIAARLPGQGQIQAPAPDRRRPHRQRAAAHVDRAAAVPAGDQGSGRRDPAVRQGHGRGAGRSRRHRRAVPDQGPDAGRPVPAARHRAAADIAVCPQRRLAQARQAVGSEGHERAAGAVARSMATCASTRRPEDAAASSTAQLHSR